MSISETQFLSALRIMARGHVAADAGQYYVPIHPRWLETHSIQELADYAGCPIYGVRPNGKWDVIARPSNPEEEG